MNYVADKCQWNNNENIFALSGITPLINFSIIFLVRVCFESFGIALVNVNKIKNSSKYCSPYFGFFTLRQSFIPSLASTSICHQFFYFFLSSILFPHTILLGYFATITLKIVAQNKSKAILIFFPHFISHASISRIVLPWKPTEKSII